MSDKNLTVTYHSQDLSQMYAKMDTLEKHSVDQVNWPGYAYNVNTQFAIAYSDQYFFLKYWVEENNIIALTDTDNGPVYKDSCVEFFVSPENTDYYYNFEFNCIGTCLYAYGNSRHDRQRATTDLLSKIIRQPSLEKKIFQEKKGFFKWDLFVAIPVECLFNSKIDLKPGLKMKGNFYKCGDGLSTPHYFTWNPIHSEKPDYHRPEFFGKINLM